jgi:PAS domain S-box-containing protein
MVQSTLLARLIPRSSLVAGYISAALVVLVGALVFWSVHRVVTSYDSVRDTHQFMNTIRQLGDNLRSAEASHQDYLLTGEEHSLDPYYSARISEPVLAARLRTLARRDASYGSRVDTLAYFGRLRLAELAEGIRIRREQGGDAARERLLSQHGEWTMAQFQRVAASLYAGVEAESDRLRFAAQSEERRATIIILLGILGAAILAVLTTILHRRHVAHQQRVYDALEERTQALQMQAAELELANAELEMTTREMVQQAAVAEASQLRLAGILGSATDAIISFDDDKRIVYINAAAERMLGVNANQVVGTEVTRFVSDQWRDRFSSYITTARFDLQASSDEVRRWQIVAVRADGGEIPVETSIAYAQAAERQGLYTAILRDVSRQRQLEEQLRQSQKMEAVGRLAGGIAHDFNNLLTVIGASSDFILQRRNFDPEAIREDILEIRKATDRAASLTRQLLAFSRRQLVHPQVTDLNAVVEEMKSMLQRLIGEDIKLETSYAVPLGSVRIDRGQLEQVIANLAVNARDAMPNGGRLEIRTEVATERENESLAVDGDRSQGFVVLSVTDTGVGISRETQARIFEPFFTTKERGKGTGLGLPTVYGIVKQAGGDVIVHSEPGRGAEFRLYFPRVETVPVADEPVSTTTLVQPLSGTETILIVEDEDSLRHLAHRILESRGYTVLDAANGQEALEVMARHGRQVDLVVSDVVMPVMGGRELVERLLPVYPLLRVLFMTGYTEDTLLQHRIAEFGITVLEKPFTPEKLARAVRTTLDRGHGRRPNVLDSMTA